MNIQFHKLKSIFLFGFILLYSIRKYVILDRDFGMNTGEVTPTMKLKRKAIYTAFAKEIENMYDTQPIN